MRFIRREKKSERPQVDGRSVSVNGATPVNETRKFVHVIRHDERECWVACEPWLLKQSVKHLAID